MSRFSFRPQVEPLDGRCLPSGNPAISISDVALAEGNVGQTAFVFSVSLSKASSKEVSVKYATANGTATAGDHDYARASGTVMFAPGETTKTITVPVNGDTRVESDEQFFVNLSGARNAIIADAQGIGTILNDDRAGSPGSVGVTIGDAAGYAGYDGSYVGTTLSFWVTLSAPATEAVTVSYSTADGTAVAGVDYVATAGTITFAPGETSAVITVEVIGNGSGEVASGAQKWFSVNLSGASGNAVIADGEGIGMIYYFFNPPPVSQDPGGYVNA